MNLLVMKIIKRTFDPNLPTVLCINSDQFNRDIGVLWERSTRYNWVCILDKELTETQVEWVPERLRAQGTYVNEISSEADAIWKRSGELGLQVIAEVKRSIPNVVAVMASNWDYWNEEGLRIACRALEIPFLVLLREHVIVEDLTDEMEMYARCKSIPPVTAVATAGDATLNLIKAFKLHPPEILRTTGFPRFDIWDKPASPSYDRPIVLFAYRKGYDADAHFVEMLYRFAAMARRHPSVPFLIKAKHSPEIALIEKIMPPHPENMHVMDSLTLPNVLANARGIVGFRSLVLYEALLSGVPILIPSWGQTNIEPTKIAPSPGDAQLKGYMEFFSDPDAFERALEELVIHGQPAVDRSGHQALFAKYFRYSPTETATKRVENFVAEFASA